jgi:hypothetical protein
MEFLREYVLPWGFFAVMVLAFGWLSRRFGGPGG